MKNNNNKLSLFVVSTLMLISTNAYTSPYLIGQAGIYGIGTDNHYFKNLLDNEYIRLTGRVGLGYFWNASKMIKLGVETGWHFNLGIRDTFGGATFKLERRSFDALGVLDLSFANHYDLFFKAGIARVKDKVTAHNFYPSTVSLSDHAMTPKIVLGAGYDLSSNVNAHVALTHELKRTNDKYLLGVVPSTSSVMAGVIYHFNSFK